MKVLILGFGNAKGRYSPPSTHCENFISPNMGGHEILTFGYNDGVDIVISPDDDFEKVLELLPHGWVPDFCLMWLLEWNLVPKGIERAPFPTIAWIPDWDYNIPYTKSCAESVDLVLSHGEPDSSAVKTITGLDNAVPFHAIGVLREYFAKKPKKIKDRKHDILYTTWIDDSIQPGRSAWINRLCSLSDKHVVHIDRNRSYPEYISLLNDSKLVLSYSRHGSIAVRVADACAQGTVVIDPGEEVKKYFEPDKEYIPVNETDFASQIEKYLNDEDKLQEMSDRAYMKAVEDFDAEKRFLCLLDFIKDRVAAARIDRQFNRLNEYEQMIRRGEHYYYAHFTGAPEVFFINMGSRLLKSSIEEFRKAVHMKATPRSLINLAISTSSYSFLFKKEAIIKTGAGESISMFEKIINDYPDYAMAYYHLGLTCFKVGNYKKALAVFREAVNVFRRADSIVDPWCLHNRDDDMFNQFIKRHLNENLLILCEGDEKGAIANIRKIYEAALLHYIAAIRESEGDVQESLTCLIDSFNLYPGTGQSITSTGRLLAALGFREESLTIFKKAVEDFPLNIDTRNYYIKLLYLYGNDKEIINEIRSALNIVRTVSELKEKSVYLKKTINSLVRLNSDSPYSVDSIGEELINEYIEIIYGYLLMQPENINLLIRLIELFNALGKTDGIFMLIEDYLEQHYNPGEADEETVMTLGKLYDFLEQTAIAESGLYLEKTAELNKQLDHAGIS